MGSDEAKIRKRHITRHQNRILVVSTTTGTQKRATDIIKSWRNQGLVVSYQNGAHANLTEKGAETEQLTEVA